MVGLVDAAFRLVKPGEVSFHVWRVENLDVRPVPLSHHGEFFDGDAYIVYSATKQSGRVEMHVHFWLGAECSIDERTVAALKAVEIDDYLDGAPTQHREVQGFESPRFKSYFKNGFRVLKGGVASGLRHVTDEFKPRLFRIKGKRSPTMTELSPISWSHFNTGDCFIVNTINKIFIWVGALSNKMERLQAAKVALRLHEERPGTTIVFVDDGKEEDMYPGDIRDFTQVLTVPPPAISEPEPDSDEVEETGSRAILKLYRCSDEDGTCKIVQEKEGPLKQTDLNSADSFIIDNGSHGIWVWVGRRASPDERRQAMSNAQGFVTKKNYPAGTPVTRVIDGAEPTEFRMLFVDWKDPRSTNGISRQYSVSKIAPTVHTKFDAASLHETPSLAADTQLVDDGTGKLTVWRLHDKELEVVPEEHFGVFFDGDCYLLHYAYTVNNNRANYLLYYWQGAHSSQDERGTIAWHAVKKDEELDGRAVQVRVVQGKEPPHFLMIFGGKMIVFEGGYASSFDGAEGQDRGIPTEFLIQVRGGEKHNTRAVQVEKRAAALNSNDVFVFAAGAITYVWCGKGSTGDERERAKGIATQWAPQGELVVVSEGQEKADFWAAFPRGKELYASDERLRDPRLKVPARLFQCSNATGVFKAEEIFNFAQNDLVEEDVMVLDAGSAIFIWIGKGANKEERLSAPQLVYEYLLSDPLGRDIDTPMIQIQQGHEPPNFTGFFGTWDTNLWESEDFDTVRTGLEAGRVIDYKEITKEITKYSVDVLSETDPDKLPEDVDVLNKEQHLTDEDFEAVFQMTRESYESLPQWRRNKLKQAVKLY